MAESPIWIGVTDAAALEGASPSNGEPSHRWRALGDALADGLGREVRIAPLTTPELMDAMVDGRLHFGLVAAGGLSNSSRSPGHVVALGLGVARPRRGLIVAAASSSIRSISDLAGQPVPPKYWSRPIHWADERCGYPE